MSTEQSCGTCRHYDHEEDHIPVGQYGYCYWTDARGVPFHLENGYWEVHANDGQSCPCWQAKEGKDD